MNETEFREKLKQANQRYIKKAAKAALAAGVIGLLIGLFIGIYMGHGLCGL